MMSQQRESFLQSGHVLTSEHSIYWVRSALWPRERLFDRSHAIITLRLDIELSRETTSTIIVDVDGVE